MQRPIRLTRDTKFNTVHMTHTGKVMRVQHYTARTFRVLILATYLDINCTFQQVENISFASNAWIVDAVAAPSEFGFNDIHRPLRWPQSGIWHSDLQENTHCNSV